MFSIEIQNPCSCAKKRKGWTKELCFSTLEEAEKVAFEMVEQGNTKFCKKHQFEAILENNIVKIETAKTVK